MSDSTRRLLSALDAAGGDIERARLLKGCSAQELEALTAEIEYHRGNAECAAQIAAENAAFEAFERELDVAPDDATRLQLIDAARSDPKRGAEFVDEWAWRRGATLQDWTNRYIAMCKVEGAR
jgi:hypothetical protein